MKLFELSINVKQDIVGGPFGSNLKATEYVEKGLPIIRLQNVDRFKFINKNIQHVTTEKAEELKSHSFKAGDIVITKLGDPLGKACIVPDLQNFKKGVISSDIVRIRIDEKKFNKEYLVYHLNSSVVASQLIVSTQGTTRPRVTLQDIRNLELNVPPLPEQQRIVQKLDALFERLNKAIALTKENLEHCRHLLPAALNEVFGEAEEKNVLLTEVCQFNPPKSETKNFGNIKVSFVPMADLNERQIDFLPKQTKQLSDVYTGYTYFGENDVLLAKVTPCFENGKSGIARNLTNKIGFGSSEYYVFRPGPQILSEWIYYNISFPDFLREGAKNMSGAVGLKRVTKDFINSWRIKLPPIDKQKKLISYLNKINSQQQQLQQHYQQQLQQLEQLKSSMLDAAFKGEL